MTFTPEQEGEIEITWCSEISEVNLQVASFGAVLITWDARQFDTALVHKIDPNTSSKAPNWAFPLRYCCQCEAISIG